MISVTVYNVYHTCTWETRDTYLGDTKKYLLFLNRKSIATQSKNTCKVQVVEPRIFIEITCGS